MDRSKLRKSVLGCGKEEWVQMCVEGGAFPTSGTVQGRVSWHMGEGRQPINRNKVFQHDGFLPTLRKVSVVC